MLRLDSTVQEERRAAREEAVGCLLEVSRSAYTLCRSTGLRYQKFYPREYQAFGGYTDSEVSKAWIHALGRASTLQRVHYTVPVHLRVPLVTTNKIPNKEQAWYPRCTGAYI